MFYMMFAALQWGRSMTLSHVLRCGIVAKLKIDKSSQGVVFIFSPMKKQQQEGQRDKEWIITLMHTWINATLRYPKTNARLSDVFLTHKSSVSIDNR